MYTAGRQARKHTKTERSEALSQKRLKTMNDATGTDLMHTMKGQSSVLTQEKRPARMPRNSPHTKAARKPATIRTEVIKWH